MHKRLMLLAVAAAVAVLSSPPQVQAQGSDALSLTAQAVKDLTDFPAQGKRYTVDLNALGGADMRQIKKATGELQDALTQAKSGGDKNAIHQLEMAVAYGKAGLHKEARLSAEGAMYYLCKQGGSEDVCSKVPKFGAYVAP